MASTEQVGAEADSPSVYLAACRQENAQAHTSAIPIFKVYLGKGKSTGHLVQLLWKTAKLKDNCERTAHKLQSETLKKASWGINFIAQVQSALCFNKFCFHLFL